MKKIAGRLGVALIVLLALGAAGYFYWQYQRISGNADQKEAQKLVKMVSQLMVLPDEVPTIATVTDKSKLENQRFFKNAVNGDKVMIFPVSSKAILYRPGIKKIIEVASVQTINNSTSANQPAPTSAAESQSITVALYNGTDSIGLTNKYERDIKSKFANIAVNDKENASRNDYQRTVVVDLSGKGGDTIKNLADFLGAKIVAMPSGESAPESDVLVILGKGAK
jgi:hypothetical protein